MKPSADQINTHFFNHKQALKSVKPIVDTYRKDLAPSKNNKKQILNYDEKALVYKMFNSLPKQKGTLDNQKPQMFLKNNKARQQPKRNKYDKYMEHLHQLELKSIKQRINKCGSIQQRKKRNYDPITHPTYFMRKPEDTNQKVSIQPFADAVLKQNQIKTTASKRPNSAHLSGTHTSTRLYSAKPCTKDHTFIINPPEPQFPEPTFKSIIDYLVDNRVYKQLDLRVLYERLCLRYGQITIQPIWQQAMQAMEKDV